MIFLIIQACMLSNLNVCRTDKVTISNPYECSQITLAQWAQEHPGYIIKKYMCSPVDKEDI